MTSRRASRRRKRSEAVYPVLPGWIVDRSDAQLEQVLRQAHEDLPPVRNTRVTIALFPPAEGLAIIAEAFGSELAGHICDQLAAAGGTEPTIVLASRQPNTATHHHERPTT